MARRKRDPENAVALPSAALAEGVQAPELHVLAVAEIQPAAHNPRSDAASDLDGLIASLASEREPYLVQPPLVERLPTGTYRLISGERRLWAITAAGWQQVACLVQSHISPIVAHSMRVVENLHRVELHPLDSAIALKIAWLTENMLALGAKEAVEGCLAKEQPPFDTLRELEQRSKEVGFAPTAPPVPWQALLDRLGLAIKRERLDKLLRVLALTPQVIELVRPLSLSEASLRAMGTLDDDDQLTLARAIQSDAHLQSRIRRIARRVKQKGYPIAKAIAEAQGRIYDPHHPEGGEAIGIDDLFEDLEIDEQVVAEGRSGRARNEGESDEEEEEPSAELGAEGADAVLRLLDLAEQLRGAITTIRKQSGGRAPRELPPPWGEIAQEAQAMIEQALSK
jgi:ParB-like chromosome segregation protein Spo0J